MPKYIKLETALSFPLANGFYDHANANEHFINGCESYKEWLGQLPTEDVKPIVRAERIWEAEPVSGNPYGSYRCSRCGTRMPHMVNYCQVCGAAFTK